MAKVHIVDPNDRMAAASPDAQAKGGHLSAPLSTLHENVQENMAS